MDGYTKSHQSLLETVGIAIIYILFTHPLTTKVVKTTRPNVMCFLRTFHFCIRSHDLAEKHSHYHGTTKGVVRQNRIRRP